MLLQKRLREIRNTLHLTQSKVAKDVDINERTYQRYENGDIEPKASNLFKLAKYFNVSTDYLLGFSDDPTRR